LKLRAVKVEGYYYRKITRITKKMQTKPVAYNKRKEEKKKVVSNALKVVQ